MSALPDYLTLHRDGVERVKNGLAVFPDTSRGDIDLIVTDKGDVVSAMRAANGASCELTVCRDQKKRNSVWFYTESNTVDHLGAQVGIQAGWSPFEHAALPLAEVFYVHDSYDEQTSCGVNVGLRALNGDGVMQLTSGKQVSTLICINQYGARIGERALPSDYFKLTGGEAPFSGLPMAIGKLEGDVGFVEFVDSGSTPRLHPEVRGEEQTTVARQLEEFVTQRALETGMPAERIQRRIIELIGQQSDDLLYQLKQVFGIRFSYRLKEHFNLVRLTFALPVYNSPLRMLDHAIDKSRAVPDALTMRELLTGAGFGYDIRKADEETLKRISGTLPEVELRFK